MCCCCVFDCCVIIIAIACMGGGGSIVVCGGVFPGSAHTVGNSETAQGIGFIAFGVYFFFAGIFGIWMKCKDNKCG